MICWRRLALAVVFAFASAQAAGALLSIDLGEIDHPGFHAERVSLVLGDDGISVQVSIGRLAVADQRWSNLRFDCPDFELNLPRLRCKGGELSVDGLAEQVRVDLDFDFESRLGRFGLKSSQGDSADIKLHADGRVVANAARLRVARLIDWVPGLADYSPAGQFDGLVELATTAAGRTVVRLDGRVTGAAFGSKDGLTAAEGLTVGLDVRARQTAQGWTFGGDIDWIAGEAYFHPLYLTAGALLSFEANLESNVLDVASATLAIEGIDTIAARGRVNLSDTSIEMLALAVTRADLSVIGPRFIAPVVAPSRPQELGFGGYVSADILIERGVLRAIDLALDSVGITDSGAGLALGPLSGVVPWRDHVSTAAKLSFEGGRWDKLELGAFELDARLFDRSVEIDRVAVPVLDGLVVLSDLALRHDPAGWSGQGAAVVEPISMALLSSAVGLPEMSGVLSASLPGLRVSPGELALDGTLVVSVFEGYLQVTELRLIEPFGISSRLYSNIVARNLNLAPLTEAFSFGGMTGFIDADLKDVELAHWRPVRFDADIRSSPGRYSKRISQRAVQNIGALGGPGVGLALQRGFLGFFETFGYREIGFSCVLDGGVCVMGGIGDSTTGPFEIVRGGGIPALNIMGYNRRVDWNELVDRLQRVIESNSAPVIN